MNGREDKYQWAGPYLYSRQMVVVKNESEIQTLSDLKGKRIAVQATTKAEDLFLHNIKSDLPQMQQVNCFSTTNEIYAALRKSYVDAIAGHESALRTFVETDPDAYRILDDSLYNSELGIAFIKGSDNEVIGKLAQALNEMQEDGTTRKIIEKYGLNPETAFSDMKGVQEWK